LKKFVCLSLAIFASITTINASLLDSTFNIGSGANGIVEQVLPLSNGQILICGNFTGFNGKNRAYIARLNSNGSVDESFTGQAGYWVRHMALQSDGKIVIGGYFSNVAGVSRNLIARLNSDGSLDSSFNPGSGCMNIIAGGVDGNMDPFVFWCVVQTDGKIILTGNFRQYNGFTTTGIVRVNPDGSRDSSFNVGSGLDSWGRHILLQPNGQILLSGWFTSYNGQGFNRLLRINSDGSADHSFNPYFGDKTAVYTTALLGNGKVLAAGHSINPDGLFTREMERLNADGSVDSSFVGYTNDKTESSVIQSDGKIIVGGAFTYADGANRTSVARFNPDGTLDSGFQASVDNFIWTVALQGDGKLLISGGFYTVDGVSMNGVARLLTGSGAPPPPPPPTDTPPSLNASAASTSQINLNWSDSSTTRTGYSIERKTGASGTYAQIATVSASTRAYSNGGLAAATQYYYRIKASNSSGTTIYSNEASATTQSGTVTSSSSATFAGSDTATHGTWKGVYGSEGYNILQNAASYPSYARVTPSGTSDWTWQWSTTDADALQRANATDRLAACWYSPSGFSVTFNITDGQKHRLSLYCLDWDVAGRIETIQIFNADSGALLDTQTISSFSSGIYVKWDITGNIRISLTPKSGNAVVGGIFFGGGSTTTPIVATPTFSPNGGTYSTSQTVSLSTSTAGAEIHYTFDGSDPTTSHALYTGPFTISSTTTVKAKAFKSGMTASATASATFTISSGTAGAKFVYAGVDSATAGNWRGKYGADGYNVIGKAVSYPVYAQVSASSAKQDWTWNNPATDPRALLTPDGSSRIAACWYSSTGFDIDLNFTDGKTHRLAAYFCDWDSAGRSERLELIDAASGAVLQTLTISNFSPGLYQIWDLKGHLKLRLTKLSGPNAVVNGLFFQTAATQL
jgi:uncharacterized delta-60 repeat protein